ncbi:MAG: alpha-ketoacid dehydrogenase subunit beta [Alicyclobacillus sp.]|nr:alpha-ketoacid dehydrogenase subunit beta [Alicyclobacillus sp.]
METSYTEALRRALDEELARDPAVVILGEDVAAGGAFGVTRGLAERYGVERVRNTPISEAAITGLAVGAAVAGLRPVLEVMFIDFITLAMDNLVNQAAKYRYMSGGQLSVPLVVRTQAGAAGGAAAQHSQSLEAWLMHVPGLLVVTPSSPCEAYGLLKAAIRQDDPVVFIEHKRLYSKREDLPASEWVAPLGQARVVRAGVDATVVTYGGMTPLVVDAAARAAAEAGIDAEVIDLRSLVPLDVDTVVQSLQRTHRLLVVHEAVQNGGVGAEVAARVAEVAFDELDAPILRVGAAFTPIPFAPELERAVLPDEQRIVSALLRLVKEA